MDELYDIKNATTEDYEDIFQFFTKTRVKFFGEYQIKYFAPEVYFSRYITHRLLIRISEQNKTIIGYAELSNSPYIPALPEDCWMDWITFHYCTKLPLSVTNTYFFNTFVYNPDYNPQMLRQIIEEFYFRENKIRFIITAQCPEYGLAFAEEQPMYMVLEPFSHIYYPRCFSAISCPNTQCLYVMFRDDMISTMRYRLALPEDNDDIVEIVHADRPELKEILGDFYIAEELLSTTTKSTLIITEIENVTSGFVWLNGDVDIYPLLINYQLDMFGNLIKFDPTHKFREKHLKITVALRTPLDILFTKESIRKLYKFSYNSLLRNNGTDLEDHVETQYEKFLKRCQLIDKKLLRSEYYIKVKNIDHAFRYNVPEDVENYPYDAFSNAFAIQLFGLIERHDPRRIFSFLNTAFVAYPDRDYCLLSISVAMRISPALFEILKYFLRVRPRPGCTNDENLYITHRSAIFGDISLFPVQSQDIPDIMNLLSKSLPLYPPSKRSKKVIGSFLASRISLASNVQEISDVSMSNDIKFKLEYDAKAIKDIIHGILHDPLSKYQCYVIKCGDSTKSSDENTAVGFAIVKPFSLTMMLRKHFILPKTDAHTNQIQAELVALKLHPFYHYQSDTVFRELARQSHYNHFYYFKPSKLPSLCNDLLANMQPVEPRRIKKIWFCNFIPNSFRSSINRCKENESEGCNDNSTPFTFDKIEDSYALFSHNLCPSLYFGNTTNIVVLGFSNMSKAFLRLIIFGWHQSSKKLSTSNYLPHLNITVITNPGVVEAEYDSKFFCNHCEKQSDCWVNFRNCDAFVRDVTDRLDVRTWVRFVSGVVQGISPGKQLVHLASGCDLYYEYLLIMCGTNYGMPDVFKNQLSEVPANYSEINFRLDKIVLYHKLQALQHLTVPGEMSIIVYGRHIRAYEFINFLLKHRVSSEEIALVIPHSVEDTKMSLIYNNCESDPSIEEILLEMVEDAGVKLYYHMNLDSFECHDSGNDLKTITLKAFPSDELVTLKCDLFVSFEERYICNDFLEVLQNSGINTEDQYIIVDRDFKTSVPFIYAIGKCIKHVEEPNHQYHFVSPMEAVSKLIVHLKWNNEPIVLEDKFSRPAYFQAALPMGYFMAKVVTPKRYLARHLTSEFGFPMTTYLDYEFCRVRLNPSGLVEEIAVVTQKVIDFDFLKYFCGRHELLLNNLKSRWFLHDIDNFVTFFQEPWVELIMNDYFEDLQNFNKELMLPTVEEIMRLQLNKEQRKKIMQNYAHDFGITSRMEEALLLFLREHRNDFFTDIALPEDFCTTEERSTSF